MTLEHKFNIKRQWKCLGGAKVTELIELMAFQFSVNAIKKTRELKRITEKKGQKRNFGKGE